MLHEKLAGYTLAGSVTLLGLSLADIGELASIFAAICAGLGSLAAAWYYIRKSK